ncbi:hypothetical protein A3F65_01280 [Candidatus Saccharibacteria bacterium RIFCSPHIGHO2_12_FULL_47_16b]|nr:MAG: hypothetical protein A3F65_01280 [Candidatus Saccharibacteria bacterium RIFCSPHIGHO2_12_FULL_47_16b]
MNDDVGINKRAKDAQPRDKSKEAAIELIRKKVEAAYVHEPDLEAEAQIPKTPGQPPKLSAHQQYAQALIKSGQSLSEIHDAWHNYYRELSDEEKHEVWQEFYQTHGQGEHYQAYAAAGSKSQRLPRSGYRPKSIGSTVRHQLQAASRRPKQKLHSLLVGLGAGVIAVLIVSFGLFNERFIAPFIQPSRAISTTQLISNSQAVSSEPKIIIPKINLEAPAIYNVTTVDENAVLKALEDGVVNLGDSARPGQNGNVVIVGHSSNNIFNKGKYKFVFVLLSRMEPGDTFYLQKDGQRYTYQVYEKKIVKPDDISVLGPRDRPATASLITCDPPGTSLNRLVVVGEQIDPDPSSNAAAPAGNLAAEAKTIPSNAPSLWSRFWSWLSR